MTSKVMQPSCLCGGCVCVRSEWPPSRMQKKDAHSHWLHTWKKTPQTQRGHVWVLYNCQPLNCLLCVWKQRDHTHTQTQEKPCCVCYLSRFTETVCLIYSTNIAKSGLKMAAVSKCTFPTAAKPKKTLEKSKKKRKLETKRERDHRDQDLLLINTLTQSLWGRIYLTARKRLSEVGLCLDRKREWKAADIQVDERCKVRRHGNMGERGTKNGKTQNFKSGGLSRFYQRHHLQLKTTLVRLTERQPDYCT